MYDILVGMILVIWFVVNIITYMKYKVVKLHSPTNIFFLMSCLIYILPLYVRDEFQSIYGEVFFCGFIFSLIGLSFGGMIKSDNEVKRDINSLKISLTIKDSYYLYILGILGYVLFFFWKGVPVFSHDLDVARVESTAGSGVLLFPSSVLLTISVWISYLYYLKNKISKYRIIFNTLFAILIMFSTGWRGHLIHLVLGLLIIYSIFNGVKFKQVLYVLFLAFLMGLLAIVRSILSQKNLYDNQIPALDLTLFEYIKYSFVYVYLRLSEHYYNFTEVVDGFQYHGFLYGNGILMDIPGGEKSLDYYIRSHFKVNDWIGGAGMPPTIFGSMYVEFGIISVMFLSILWSGIMSIFYSLTRFSSALHVCCYVSTLIWFIKSILGQVGLSFLIYGTVYFICIIAVFNIKKFLLLVTNK